MTPLNLNEIKARERKATKGPTSKRVGIVFHRIGCAWPIVQCSELADLEFYKHARTDIPALVAEVERLQGELTEEKAKQ